MLKISGAIPIHIYPFFWLLAIAIGWINTLTIQGTAIWTVLILISVLVHEYGHALTALAFGQKSHIELVGFGGVTQRSGIKPKLWQEFIIVLNGPLAGFMLCGLAWWVQNKLSITHPDSLVTYAFTVAFYINLFWTIINLLPIQPMDGGKLMSIVLEGLFGLRGTKIALFISLLLAGLLGVFFFAIQAYLAGALFFIFTYESYRAWKSSLAMTDQDQNFILQHLLKETEKDIRQGNQEEAMQKLMRIREMSKAGLIFSKSTEFLAAMLAEKANYKEAYELLEPHKNKLSPDSLRLLHNLAYRLGQWQEAIVLGDNAYHFFPTYDVALINAFCHSLLGQVRPAIGWLQCAIREGIPNARQVLEQHEFDAIRNDPLFLQLKNTL